MDNKPNKIKWSRRRWLAEQFGCDLADVTEYQPGYNGSGRLPIYDCGGLCVVELPGDSQARLNKALEGYEATVTAKKHWEDPAVTVHSLEA